jgi:hypothetical protein
MASALLLVDEAGIVAKVVGIKGGKSEGRTFQEWLEKDWTITSLAVHPEPRSSPMPPTTVFVALEKRYR